MSFETCYSFLSYPSKQRAWAARAPTFSLRSTWPLTTTLCKAPTARRRPSSSTRCRCSSSSSSRSLQLPSCLRLGTTLLLRRYTTRQGRPERLAACCNSNSSSLTCSCPRTITWWTPWGRFHVIKKLQKFLFSSFTTLFHFFCRESRGHIPVRHLRPP